MFVWPGTASRATSGGGHSFDYVSGAEFDRSCAGRVQPKIRAEHTNPEPGRAEENQEEMRWKELSLAWIGLSAQWISHLSAADQHVLDLPQYSVPSKDALPVRVTNYLRTIDIAGYDSEKGIHVVEVEWPHPEKDEAVITINSHFLGQTTPRPKSLAQDEGAKQGLYWEGDLLAGFGALQGTLTDDAPVKVKVKTPTPRVFQKQTPSGFDVQQASGSNLMVFTSKLSGSKLSDEPQIATIHYFQPFPLMVIGNLTRLVEVSHWGNNVAIEDQIHLENRGPTLKGSFSRVVHHNAIYARSPGGTAHVLTGLTLELPQGVKSPYYIDTIGNVSTSRFRPSMPAAGTVPINQQNKFKKVKEAKSSKLELTPRYPIAGGWNYTFTIGYNLDAGRLLKQTEPGTYILKVPFFTNALDVPIDQATLRVRLPEGSFNIDVYTPFPVTELEEDLIDKTYLDTSGHPTISIKKLRCTEKHAGDIYITYLRAPVVSLQKPLVIAAWMMSLFILAAGFRRFEWKI
ncbi:hypothetical protein KEM48_003296 [Puccinia striiformis f. sp. tritici PST-130]|nr:hypothetical protein KEM48_003296 [Puccinia striiformis f. sp. tritici PST-130]